ncbi:hypothetical protein EW026_g5672 [Hermanssonia centrifuga]|uniref:SEP-domain-containing protein n=1 Tax=Hermanssonia centrifuga TaxID=98765 RepID=A0A4S4KDL3_9APHY|nr:hypothetical protein EW026_g5672 [Hermanssonia centrifuga]
MPGGDLVRDLLRRAAEGGTARPPADAPASSGAFSGGGHTLGGEGTESAYIPDPSAAGTNAETESAIRHLTFWRDGFTVEDGDLMRYDDPNNAQILDEINSGRAPPSILNVQAGQHVELRVTKRTEEAYVPSPKKLAAFSGAGNRLGSPAPGAAEAASSSSSRAMPGTFPISGNIVASNAPAVERESLSTRFEVDQTQPTTSIQIRLADGTRMVCRMNLTHIVRDIRNFINASRPENSSRPYNIMTTFPNRVLEDETQTIEKAGLINSVVVQRWV